LECNDLRGAFGEEPTSIILTFILTLIFSPSTGFMDGLILLSETEFGAGEGNRTLVSQRNWK
jgi:hypothetical protein